MLASLWVLVLVLAVSCEQAYIDGFALSTAQGLTVRLARDADGRDSPLEVSPYATALYRLETPLQGYDGEDLIVSLSGTSAVEVLACGDTSGKEELVSTGVELLLPAAVEARLRLFAGAAVSSIAVINSGPETITVHGFETGASCSGYESAPGFLKVDSTTRILEHDDGMVSSVRLRIGQADSSLVVAVAQSGKVDVAAMNGSGMPLFSATADARAGTVLAIPAVAFGAGETVDLSSAGGIRSAHFLYDVPAPLADLHAVLHLPAPEGDYSLYRWDALPATLVFDFKDYDTQDRYLKRLAFFAEKPGFRGRLATDTEIAPLHGWNAHDYSTKTLRAFFAEAIDTAFPLNADEMSFMELLLDYGVLKRDEDGSLLEGQGAVISISRESPAYLRRVFIDHEASHAVFFQDSEYRALSAALWNGLDPASRRFWTLHFKWRHYDVLDEYLCINEMQAYLVQQPISALSGYYEALTRRLMDAYPDNASVIEEDAATAISGMLVNARTLEEYLEGRWGLNAGAFGHLYNVQTHR